MKKNGMILFALLPCALAVRLLAYRLTPVLSRDSCTYVSIAEKISEAGDFNIVLTAFPQITVPPLFLSLTELLMYCGLSAETAAISINLVCGTLIPFVFASVAWLLFRSKKMFWGVLLLAICHPLLIQLSVEAQRDALYLLLSGLLCLLLCLTGIRRNLWYCAGAGVFFALCVLTRYEALEFIPILILSGIILAFRRKVHLKALILYPGAFLIAAFLCCWIFIQLSGSGAYLKKHYAHFCRIKMDLVLQSYQEGQK